MKQIISHTSFHHVFRMGFIIGALCLGHNFHCAHAQTLVPLWETPSNATYLRVSNDSSTTDSTTSTINTLSLPFFEDFSGTLGSPDTMKWLKNSGVFINNTYSTNPPSVNFGTFDGHNENGTPYNFEDERSIGQNDMLTSHYFDLDSMSLDTGLVMRFYWQAGGIGDLPELEDSLVLEFKDSLGKFNLVWEKVGTGTLEQGTGTSASTAPFELATIDFSGTQFNVYLHDKFQFRFRNFGRQSGFFDLWHIDYIELFSQKAADADTTLLRVNTPAKNNDVALRGIPGPVFKNYTSIPVDHFAKAVSSADTISDTSPFNPTLNVSLINLAENSIEIISRGCIVKDGIRDTVLKILPGSIDGRISGSFPIGGGQELGMQVTNNLTGSPVWSDSMHLIYEFFIDQAGGLKSKSNDTIRLESQLRDYYAYDDGTAEYGYGINQPSGFLAYKYDIDERDTLTYVDVYIPKVNQDFSSPNINKTIYITVWDSLVDDDPDRRYQLSRRTLTVNYADSLNKFLRVYLGQPLIVQGSFYIGYEESAVGIKDSPQFLIGYDSNTVGISDIYFKVSERWEKDVNHRGSLMLRPVFPMGDTLNPIPEIITLQEELTLYPNPANDLIYLNIPVDNIEVVDLMGRQHTAYYNRDANSIDIRGLPEGLYLLVAETPKKRRITKRFYKQSGE